MKKLLCRLLAVTLCLAVFVPSALADVTYRSSPIDLFSASLCLQGDVPLDYSYYSPVQENDSTKYPLVVWLHGYSYGGFPGDEILSSSIAGWATQELQDRFDETGGAFVLVPRAPEDHGLYWSEDLTDTVMDLILDFILQHEANIDLSRIYIGGHSLGGMMTWKLITAYPDFFAAAFMASPYYSPTDEELDAVADMPIWIISSLYDQVTVYDTYIAPVWQRLIETSHVPEQCRLSILGNLRNIDGHPNFNAHQSWQPVLNDLQTDRGESYFNMVTVNGCVETLDLEEDGYLIRWLSRKSRSDVDLRDYLPVH